MEENLAPFETLKQILRHARQPDLLNDHPWTQSLIVHEALGHDPSLTAASPGQQLVEALAGLFKQLQPANPPRAGKRLDPRWGEFGLLAALYFTPFNHGTSFPTSLMDAWRRIDPAILHFVFGSPAERLSEEQIRKYELVGPEVEYGSASTLSDWHRKGLQRFAEIILNRERFLSRNLARPSVILQPGSTSRSGSQGEGDSGAREKTRLSRRKRVFLLVLAIGAIVALGLGSLKVSRIYQKGMLLYQDLTDLREMMQAPLEMEVLEAAGPRLMTFQNHLAAFKVEAGSVLWMAPRLSWIPVYGGDLASAPDLIELAEHLLQASMLSSQAARPLLDEFRSSGSHMDPEGLTALLLQAQPALEEIRVELDGAVAARTKVAAGELSPRLGDLLVQELDPRLALADEGLSLARALPGLVGAGSDGPKTYMLLAQNEDELRPTGGFITSVGHLVLHDGRVIRMQFESVDTDVQEDWSQPYPAAPWQLQEYMDSPVLILRDSNWFTDFPTTVQWAEYLYAYKHSHSVDGVIAFDQQFLVMLLGEIGPLQIEGAPYPITPENVIEYMRQSKIPPGETTNWYRKDFIDKLGTAILSELDGGEQHDWQRLASLLQRALAERHLLLQFDDPAMTSFLAQRGWDNAVRPGDGDYLMAVDTNIGFNKTNAVVDISLTYDVDLTDLASPRATLTINHRNHASKEVPCDPMNIPAGFEGEEYYPINRCYWNYLRVYKQADVTLLDATPQAILGGWLVGSGNLPPRVDELEEEIPGVTGFGTLQVLHGGQSLITSFDFALPPDVVIESDPGRHSYHLRVQKQPGTRAVPLTVRIHLPARAVLESVSGQAVVQGQSLLLETDLLTDVELEVRFRTSLVE